MDEILNGPIISVLLPVFNGEKYIQNSIDSILAQTYKDFEILILNDGSTDKTTKIITSYKDNRIRIIKNDENIGLIKTLNKGISLSRGKYIARMDCDDISSKNRLKLQFNFLENNIDYGVCGSWINVFGARNEIWKYPVKNTEIKSELLFSSPLVHPSAMIRSSILKNNVIYNKDYKHAEDYKLWMDLSNKTKFYNIPKPLLAYRLHENQIGNVYSDKQMETAFKIQNELLTKLDLNIQNEHKLIIQQYSGDYNYLISMQKYLDILRNKNIIYEVFDKKSLNRTLIKYWLRQIKLSKLNLYKKLLFIIRNNIFSQKDIISYILRK